MLQTNLTNQFLIAMPSFKDKDFEKTVIYICSHEYEEGAMGIMINKPSPIKLDEVFKQLGIKHELKNPGEKAVFQGGPIQTERGFILYNSSLDKNAASTNIADDIYVSTSKEILSSIAKGDGPNDYLIALGYAGWAKGQLEKELMSNVWLNGSASLDVIFNTSHEKCWHEAAKHIGVSLDKLSYNIGHA